MKNLKNDGNDARLVGPLHRDDAALIGVVGQKPTFSVVRDEARLNFLLPKIEA